MNEPKNFFFLIGAAKSGTTTLAKILEDHPEVCFSKIKEPKFFTNVHYKKIGNGPGDRDAMKHVIKSLNDYKNLFDPKNTSTIYGEASADYLYHYQTAIPKIKEFCDEPKILIMLRNPIKRSFSAYSHLIREGREYLSFKEAILQEKLRITDNYEFLWHYVNASMYFDGVQAYLNNFKSVKIIIFEEFILEPKLAINSINEFLEIKKIEGDFHLPRMNKSGKRRYPFLYDLKKNLSKNIRNLFKTDCIPNYLKYPFYWINKLDKLTMERSDHEYLKKVFESEILRLSEILKKDLKKLWK